MRYLLSLVLVAALAVPAFAAFKGDGSVGGAYKGPGAMPTADTVAAAKNLPDDAHVTLTGNIVRQIDKKDYLFKDATGEIQVEISPKRFPAQDITPDTKVRISGEVDKDWGGVEIDVKYIEVLK